MIPTIDGSAEQFLANIERIQGAMDRAQQQISSGLKVQRPSDSPDDIAEILQSRNDIDRNSQIQTNLSRVKSEVDTGEKTLETAVSLVERAAVLGTQGAGSLPTAAQRQSMAQEVQGLLEQLVGLSATTVEGRYIFSGDKDQSAAYQVNLANPNGVNRLFTTTTTRQIQDTNGISFAVAKIAQDIFDHRNPDDSLAPDNVFAAVNSLRVALLNNDSAGIDTALTAVRNAGDYLNTQLSFYGTVQNRIAAAVDLASKFQLQLKSDLSSRQDADITAAALELSQNQTRLDAAMSARAKLPKTSLFDYLG